jgi:gliding motility-associated-like protein
MKTMFRHFFLLASLLAMGLTAWGDEVPSIAPTGTIVSGGSEEEGDDSGKSYNAPLTVRFEANPENVGDYSATYEWRFYLNSMEEEPYLVRFEQDTEFTFTQYGDHLVVCYATFIHGNDTVAYTQDYWHDAEPLKYAISESILEMPNAFSPNGDDKNPIYCAKKYRSIVEFRAIIFNRWGQKLYEWTDPAGGWDGTYNGHDVRQGVYYVLVRAKGSDGRKYNIRKDVNLLRGYTETSGNTQ